MNDKAQDIEARSLSPEDYQDLDFSELQVLSNYIMRDSIPKNLTFQQMNQVAECLTNLINISHYNLNLLRNLAGDDDFPFPEKGGETNESEDTVNV